MGGSSSVSSQNSSGTWDATQPDRRNPSGQNASTINLASVALLDARLEDCYPVSLEQIVHQNWDKSLAGQPVHIKLDKDKYPYNVGVCLASIRIQPPMQSESCLYHAIYLFDINNAPRQELVFSTGHGCRSALAGPLAIRDDLVEFVRAIVCSRFWDVGRRVAFARIISFDKGPTDGETPECYDRYSPRELSKENRLHVCDMPWDELIARRGPRALEALRNMSADVK